MGEERREREKESGVIAKAVVISDAHVGYQEGPSSDPGGQRSRSQRIEKRRELFRFSNSETRHEVSAAHCTHANTHGTRIQLTLRRPARLQLFHGFFRPGRS